MHVLAQTSGVGQQVNDFFMPSPAHCHAETADLKYTFIKVHSIVQYFNVLSEDPRDVVHQMISHMLQLCSKTEILQPLGQ